MEKSESHFECWKRRGLSQRYKERAGWELRNPSKPLCYSRDRDRTSLDTKAPIKAGGTKVRDRNAFLNSEVCSA